MTTPNNPVPGDLLNSILSSALYDVLKWAVLCLLGLLIAFWYNRKSLKVWWYCFLIEYRKEKIQGDKVDISGFYHARYEHKKAGRPTETSLYGEVIFIFKDENSLGCTGFVFKRHKMKGEKYVQGEELTHSPTKRFTGYYSIGNRNLCGVWFDPSEPDEVAGTFILQLNKKGQLIGEWRGADKKSPLEIKPIVSGKWEFTFLSKNRNDYSKKLPVGSTDGDIEKFIKWNKTP